MPDRPASELLRELEAQCASKDSWFDARLEAVAALPAIIAQVREAERQVAESHPDDVDLELAAALADLRKELGGGA